MSNKETRDLEKEFENASELLLRAAFAYHRIAFETGRNKSKHMCAATFSNSEDREADFLVYLCRGREYIQEAVERLYAGSE